MQNNELVSVVVPVYNVEKYLDRCVKSIVNQTYTNLEILLIDDGSPDRCPQMCDDWAKKDSRIRVIHKENQGLGMARNTGIENAFGEFICFFDSDDYIDLELIQKAHTKIRLEQADIVLYGAINERDNKYTYRVPDPIQDVYEGNDVLSRFLPEFIGPYPETGRHANLPRAAWAVMYRMDLIHRANWRFASEREIIAEDIYSHLVLYKDVRRIAILRECLYYYCVNDASLSRSYRSDRFERIKFFYEKCLEICEKHQYPEQVTRRCMEPFVAFTIAALKQEMACSENPKEGIRCIVDDPVLQEVLRTKQRDKQNIKKTMLFWVIRKKWYWAVRVLLNAQNRLQQG